MGCRPRQVEGTLELGFRRDSRGLFARALAWHDRALTHDSHPWGNLPNGLVADSRLSDAGFSRRARFSGLELDEAYVFGSNPLGVARLEWKLGQTKLACGSRFTIAGGLSDLTARELPGQRAAGALTEETSVAVPGVSATLALTPTTAVDAFVQTAFRSNVANGRGTFFSTIDSSKAVQEAIRGAQRGAVMYPEFKRLSMRAGCIGYTTWLVGRQITDYSRKGETHVEHFPD